MVAVLASQTTSSSRVERSFQTLEIDEIPHDWHLVSVGDHLDFKNGLNKAKAYFGSGFPIVNYLDVYRNQALRADDVAGLVNVDSRERLSYSARKGDTFFTRTSETPEEIGISAVLVDDIEDAVFSGFVLRGRPKNELLTEDFKRYCFSSGKVRGQIAATCSYTTRALTNGRSLSSILVPSPTLAVEQNAIAKALTDADEAIRALKAVIAKKRDVKQATLHALLTPTRRLPGFEDNWRYCLLGDLLQVRHGKSQKAVETPNGSIPILATSGQIGSASEPLYAGPSLLIGRKGTIDKPQFSAGPFWSVDTLFYTEILQPNVPKFLFYLACLIPWKSYNEASGVPSLNAKTIESIEVKVPTHEEQAAITTILSDMDAELDALETRLDKLRQVKRGMMQVLLTGKVRLV